MTVQELMEVLKEMDPEAKVSVSIDTGRSYRFGPMTGVSYGDDDEGIILCGEEDEDFCP